MTGEEIIKAVRYQLDDIEEEYLWEDHELVEYLNRALSDFVRQTRILGDASTVAAVQVKLLTNLGIYSVHPSVLSIEGGKLESIGTPLELKSRQVLDDTYPYWQTATGTPRYIVTVQEALSVMKMQFVPVYYPGNVGEVDGVANITFNALAKTITKAGAAFTTHYAIGDEISVDGTSSNDREFTLANVTDTVLTVNETVSDEVNTSAIIRKVEDTADLTVKRLPITEFTVNNLQTQSPEIPVIYHRELYEGIRGYAYQKQDVDTFDEKAAEKFLSKFAMNIEQVKRELVRQKSVRHFMGPHPGTI